MRKDYTNVSSVLMENTIETINVITELNEIITNLDEAKSDGEKRFLIQDFYNRIESWQIVAAQPKNLLVWMQIPMKYYEIKKELKSIDRLRILRDKGIWVKPIVTEKYAEMVSNVQIPMEVSLDPLNFSFARESIEDKFYYSISHLIGKIIEIMAENNSPAIAVYERPYGVVAMNNVNYWVNKLEKETRVDTSVLRESLTTIPFSDLIKNSILKTTADKDLLDKLKSILEEGKFNLET